MINEFNLLGGEIITPVEERFSNLYVSDNQVSLVQSKASNNASSLDVSGCYVTPGLIDLQVNGTDACDLWANPSKEEFDALCQQLLKSGVTAFLPTLITASPEHIKKNIAFLESLGVMGGNAASGKSG